MLGGVLIGGTLGFLLTSSPLLAGAGQLPVRLLHWIAHWITHSTGVSQAAVQFGPAVPIDRVVTSATVGLAAAVVLGLARNRSMSWKICLSAFAGAIAIGNACFEWHSISRPDPTAWELAPLVVAGIAAMVVFTEATEASAEDSKT